MCRVDCKYVGIHKILVPKVGNFWFVVFVWVKLLLWLLYDIGFLLYRFYAALRTFSFDVEQYICSFPNFLPIKILVDRNSFFFLLGLRIYNHSVFLFECLKPYGILDALGCRIKRCYYHVDQSWYHSSSFYIHHHFRQNEKTLVSGQNDIPWFLGEWIIISRLFGYWCSLKVFSFICQSLSSVEILKFGIVELP